jgi:nicotinamidase-related amidase
VGQLDGSRECRRVAHPCACAKAARALPPGLEPAAREGDALSIADRVLDRARSALLVIDLQESYRSKLHSEARLIAASQRMLQAAVLLGVPVIVTEQYPRGLGPTREEIAAYVPLDAARFEKTTFSALGAPGLREHLTAIGRDQVAIVGIETHVCVGQTVHELLAAGCAVHAVRDAISARFALDDETGFAKLVGSGAVPTTSECALFEWLRDARAPEFKAVHRLVV